MLKDKRPGLFPMTIGAPFVQARHRQSSGRLQNVQPMWIVALPTVHLALRDRVVLRKVELRVDLQVALITRLRVLPWVDDEFLAARAPDGDMFARRAMARFTSGLARHFTTLEVQSRVGAGRKCPRDLGVAIETYLVPDKARPFDHWGRRYRPVDGRTGINQQGQHGKPRTQRQPNGHPQNRHL